MDTHCTHLGNSHRHEHFELFWLQGPGIHINDSEAYSLSPDKPTLVFVSSRQVHRWEKRELISGTVLSFTSSFFDGREPPPSTLHDHGFVFSREQPPVLMADEELISEVSPLIARCEKEFATRAPHWDDAIRAALRLILASADQAHQRQSPPPNQPSHPRLLVQHFQSLVESKFATQSSVAAYAQNLGVSPGHLNDIVREVTGSTAGEIIRTRVLLEARRLLLHTDLTVSEIAYQLGFSDPSYFAKTFRKSLRQTPGDFREAIRKTHQTLRK